MNDASMQSELYAVHCLRMFYPEFENIKKRESPDFQFCDGSTGIEIVRAENEEERVTLAATMRRLNPRYCDKCKKHKPTQILYLNNEFYDPSENAKHVYLQKQKTLNKTSFTIFPSNRLVIIAPMDHFDNGTAKQFSDFLSSSCGKYQNDFDVVYIISYEHIMKFCVGNGTYEIHPLSREQHYEANRLAAQDCEKISNPNSF